MRRQLTALALAAALAPALVACSGDDSPTATPASSSSPDSSSGSSSPSASASPTEIDCSTLLSQADAEKVAGTSLDDPRGAGQDGVEACQWTGSSSGVQAIKASADQWVSQLPSMLTQLEASGTKVPKAVRAKVSAGLKSAQQGQQISPDQACGLFSDLAALPGTGSPAGTVDLVLPSSHKPQAVAAQSCTDGTFWSITVAFKTLPRSKVAATTDRADAALATLAG